MPYNLKNRNVLVTGSSRGLGAVISEKFALEGANVAINYANDKTAADELVQKLKAHGTKIVALKADCGVIDEINHLVNETIKELGGLDVLIGNAVCLDEFFYNITTYNFVFGARFPLLFNSPFLHSKTVIQTLASYI